MPFVEQNDYDIKCNYPICDGVIEFVTDKKLDDCEIILEGSYKRNLSYNDFMNNDSLAILISYDVAFVKEINDKFFIKHCSLGSNQMKTYYVIASIARFL